MIAPLFALALQASPLLAVEVRTRRRARRVVVPAAEVVASQDLEQCCWPTHARSVRILTDAKGRWIVLPQLRPGMDGFYDAVPPFNRSQK